MRQVAADLWPVVAERAQRLLDLYPPLVIETLNARRHQVVVLLLERQIGARVLQQGAVETVDVRLHRVGPRRRGAQRERGQGEHQGSRRPATARFGRAPGDRLGVAPRGGLLLRRGGFRIDLLLLAGAAPAQPTCPGAWPHVVVAHAARVDVRELGAEEHDQRRVVDPEDEHHQRAGRAVEIDQRPAAEVEPDHDPPDGEQNGGDHGTEGDVVPADLGVRQDAVDQREENRDEEEGDRVVAPQHRARGDVEACREPLVQHVDDARGHLREHQEETDRHHHAEGEQSLVHQRAQHPTRARLDLPDVVQGALQLGEGGGGAEQHGEDADELRHDSLLRPAGALQHLLDDPRRGAAGGAAHFGVDALPHHPLAEELVRPSR